MSAATCKQAESGLAKNLHGGQALKAKKVVYNVVCANDPTHEFKKIVYIKPGSEDQESQIQAYCALCNDTVTITIRGEHVPDQDVLRRFNLE